MKFSRREFVGTSVAGLAGLYAGGAFAANSSTNLANALPDEDGYQLWLRYASPGKIAADYRRQFTHVLVEGNSPTFDVIKHELEIALLSLHRIPTSSASQSIMDDTVPPRNPPAFGFAPPGIVITPTLLIGTPESSQLIRNLKWDSDLAAAGPEGYLIRNTTIEKHPVIVIASSGEIGALYGTFHFLRLLQTAQPINKLKISERPKLDLRLLNQWDNLEGSIERGYGGNSIWKWNDLPAKLDPRYTDLARACASLGINGTVINNVNANIRFLNPNFLPKLSALADVWRPYGLRLYLSINFGAPKTLGGLATADPLDKSVADWWKAKADEIYKAIPNFGGFLVKANSEGQPGPKDYQRNHAEGANVIADALAPHKGCVIWRAFVYDEEVDPDRAKRAYIEFTKLDGQFRPNALVQIKNGAIDFQPREPFHPLFGALKKTSAIAEIQASQEYLGQAKHLVYLGTMWKEFLDSDTYANGKGSTVGKVLATKSSPDSVTGMVSVTNPGSDRNWCGHHFSQANWFAFGRLAWNHELSAADIAEEWTRMTFTNDTKAVRTIRDLMMSSRETFVNYTMPLGLHHLIGGDHYAPQPQNSRGQRRDWTATYYHQASADAVGFDRTKTGDKAVEQYFPPVCDMFNNLATCPEIFLLWFHRCKWDYKLKSGKKLWDALCKHYFDGAKQTKAMQATWNSLAGKIDARRHKEVADRLVIQVTDSAAWRDQILAYFSGINKLPIIKS